MEFTLWSRFAPAVTATTSQRGLSASLATVAKSSDPNRGLNLALHTGDNLELVRANRKQWREALHLAPHQIVFTHQVHSTLLAEVTPIDGGRGWESFEDGVLADALYTKAAHLALAVYHADCVPIFFYAPKHHIVGIIHAGFPGTKRSITKVVISELMAKENIKPEDLYFNLGPSLTFSHQLITRKERDQIAALGTSFHFALKAVDQTYFFDTPLMNFIHLRELGIPVANIDYARECVYEHEDKYYSVARDQTIGRNVSLIYQK